MYPMRLRMSKVQAKIIILVIWSAALVTSLPTALLSSLTPVLGESISSLPSTPMATTASPTTSTTFKSTQTLSNATDQLATTTTPTTTSPDNALQEDQPQKYFCQEGWSFWPHGKYYYSMTLMILQFVLPLFVLVITYTRIVIVVWGKRMPGEEDNARDARMARSKRKVSKSRPNELHWYPLRSLCLHVGFERQEKREVSYWQSARLVLVDAHSLDELAAAH